MLAGLSLITSFHTKAYAQQTKNCPIADNSSGVVDEPIVCDGSSGTTVLNTSSGGSKIEMDIDMGKHSGKEAVKIMSGADITIMKSLKVTGWSGQKPVIKVEKGGKLMMKGEVEVNVTGVGMKKVIMVDGGMLMLDGVGMIEGKGSGEVIEVNKEGTLMLMGKSTITIKGSGKGVQMGSMETLVMMRDVTFEGVTEGININGGKGTGLSVMGMGGTTMTVKNSGSGVVGVVGIKVEDTGTINATVMRLKIVGSGTGSGSKGVEALGKGGTLKMMGGSITFASGGTG
ncbi:hypothetical protein [Bartonella bovis]|nr:hypothetical protein [Bartonella bovis]